MPSLTCIRWWMVVLLLLGSSAVVAGNAPARFTAQDDSTDAEQPHFNDVNVRVEYPWGSVEEDKEVDVIVKEEPGKPIRLVLVKGSLRRCEITIRGGIVVKLFEAKTGKLIRTFSSE